MSFLRKTVEIFDTVRRIHDATRGTFVDTAGSWAPTTSCERKKKTNNSTCQRDGSCSEASVADRPEKSPARNSGQPQRSAGGMGRSLTTKRTLRVSSFLRKGTALSSFLQKGILRSCRREPLHPGDSLGTRPDKTRHGKRWAKT